MALPNQIVTAPSGKRYRLRRAESPVPAVAPPRETPTSFFDRPTARLLFPGIGQAVGTAGGIAAGTAAVGVGAVPGGLVGAATGAGAGEAARQFLARLTGGGPRSMTEALLRPV